VERQLPLLISYSVGGSDGFGSAGCGSAGCGRVAVRGAVLVTEAVIGTALVIGSSEGCCFSDGQ
jgi:hypothetical protein